MKKIVIVTLHTSYWVLYLMLVSLFFLALPSENKPGLLEGLLSPQILLTVFVPAVLGFYGFAYFVFDQYLLKKKILHAFIIAVSLSLCTGLLCFAFIRVFGPRYVLKGKEAVFTGISFISVVALVHGVISLVLKGAISWYDELKLKEELKRKNYETELELIKSQLNPHFLFNTINNIDVLIEKDPAKASLYLNQLSDMMRFMLYESKAPIIPLEKELAYISKYIDLQKIRHSNERYIRYHVNADGSLTEIEPMLFIPFIENAFKHSINKNISNAIDISFELHNGTITFSCENKYTQKESDILGVGDQLMNRRLNLLFPGRHKLTVTDENQTYKVKLVIDHAN